MRAEGAFVSQWNGRYQNDGRTHSARIWVVFALLLAPLAHANEGANASKAADAKAAAADAKPGKTESTKPAPAPVKRLLVLDPTANHVDEQTVQIVSGLLTVELAALGDLEVISGTDVRRMMDLEVEKVSLGCSAESCLSEIADAFGTDLVVFGNIGRLGELYILTLNLFETVTAKSKGRISVQTRTIEELPAKLSQELPNLMASVRPPPKAPAVPIASAQPAPADKVGANSAPPATQARTMGQDAPQLADDVSRMAMTAAGVVFSLGGLAGVGVGLVPWVQHELAVQQANAVKQTDWDAYNEAQRAGADARNAYQTLGLPALGAGGAALALGTLLWVGAALLAPGEAAE